MGPKNQFGICGNSDYAEKNTLVLVNLTREFVRISRKFGLRGEKCIGFDQFDQKICSDDAIIRITRSLLCIITDPTVATDRKQTDHIKKNGEIT